MQHNSDKKTISVALKHIEILKCFKLAAKLQQKFKRNEKQNSKTLPSKRNSQSQIFEVQLIGSN